MSESNEHLAHAIATELMVPNDGTLRRCDRLVMFRDGRDMGGYSFEGLKKTLIRLLPPLLTPQPQGETIKVRAAVIEVEAGSIEDGVVVVGYDPASSADTPEEFDEWCIKDANTLVARGGRLLAWIEADVPLPTVPTVTASVERANVHAD